MKNVIEIKMDKIEYHAMIKLILKRFTSTEIFNEMKNISTHTAPSFINQKYAIKYFA